MSVVYTHLHRPPSPLSLRDELDTLLNVLLEFGNASSEELLLLSAERAEVVDLLNTVGLRDAT